MPHSPRFKILYYMVNCKSITVGQTKLAVGGDGSLSMTAVESDNAAAGTVNADSLYLEGRRCALNGSLDGLVLEDEPTGVGTAVHQGGIYADTLVTGDYVINANTVVPLVFSYTGVVARDAERGVVTFAGKTAPISGAAEIITDGGEYIILYRESPRADDPDAVTVRSARRVVRAHVTFAAYDIEGGFYGMTDVSSGATYLDPATSPDAYAAETLYSVVLAVDDRAASTYMWGVQVEIVSAAEVAVAPHMFSSVYGMSLDGIPTYTNRTSYTPLFDTTSAEYVMDLYSWVYANAPSTAGVTRVRAWTRKGGAYAELELAVPSGAAGVLASGGVQVVSDGPLPQLEYASGFGGLAVAVNIVGSYDPYDEFLVRQAARKWSGIVTSEHAVSISVSFAALADGILGSAGPTDFEYKNGRWYSIAGEMELNTSYWSQEKGRHKHDHRPHAYYTLLHEMGHIFGIGTLWLNHGLVSQGPWYTDANYWDSDYSTALYIGQNGVREYKQYQIMANPEIEEARVLGIPVEEDGGAGTKGGHIEEGDGYHSVRIFDGYEHVGLDHELMTGWSEQTAVPEPLSRITVGMMQDLGYGVSYAKADAYEM